ncbi:hypothetical protein, partial [Enterobacter intestinihominis]
TLARIRRCSFSPSGGTLAGPTDHVGRVRRSRHPAMFSERELHRNQHQAYQHHQDGELHGIFTKSLDDMSLDSPL